MTSAYRPPYLYYVSYARADTEKEPGFREFLNDLAAEVGAYSGSPDDQVGFVDLEMPVGVTWPAEVEQALSTSRVLLSLYSPAYFQSPNCAREWQAFRYRQSLAKEPTRARPVFPVLWTDGDYLSTLPRTVSNLRWLSPGGGGLLPLIRQRDSEQYRSVLSQLAREIFQAVKDNDDAGMPDLPPEVFAALPDTFEAAFIDREGQPTVRREGGPTVPPDSVKVASPIEAVPPFADQPNRPETEYGVPETVQQRPPSDIGKLPDEPPDATKTPDRDVPPAPTPPPPPPPPADERVPAHDDIPALIDELGRRPFAEVLTARMREIWRSQKAEEERQKAERKKAKKEEKEPKGPPQTHAGAFMINVHGPWGAGKTSVLNLMRADLQPEASVHLKSVSQNPAQTTKAQRRDERWVVIDYNAWMNQRIQPPWWSLIKAVFSQSVQQMGFWRGWRLRISWFLWRAWADWVPTLIAAAAVAIAIMAATGVFERLGFNQDLSKTAADLLKGVTTLAGLGGALYVFSRSLVFGSASAAQTYSEGRTDPLSPIVKLFSRLIRAIERPVAVFIDDLDRCDSQYVVRLLEGIQTLFRSVPLIYVVAADRKWICASYEKTYEQFAKQVGEPGRPLGYLFLDKIFQASAAIPQISEDYRQKFWKGLLQARTEVDTATADLEMKQVEAQVQREIEGQFSQAELQVKVEEATAGPNPTRAEVVREQATRAAAAKQITTPNAQAETESRLQPFGPLLEPNPRSMKRLVNAYGFHQAAHFLEGRTVTPEALARWTIIELRWPLLAELLTDRPQLISEFLSGTLPAESKLAAEFQPLCGDEELVRVFTGNDDGLTSPLDEATVRQITGTRSLVRSPA